MPISDGFSRRLLPILDDLVEAYATPFHIYDEAGIVEWHLNLTRAFASVPFKQFFAVKALPNPHILRLLRANGSGLDCSSASELRLAAMAGVTGCEVIFTSNNTTRDEYALAMSMGATINLDDTCALRTLQCLPEVVSFRAAALSSAVACGLMGDATQSKFGVPAWEIVDAYRRAKNCGARRFGIHGMTCANELSARRAADAAVSLLAHAAKIAQQLGITFDFVNVGGGLGIPYRPGEAPFDLAAFARQVHSAWDTCFRFQPAPPMIHMECGRYVTGPHGVLISRVVNRFRKSKEFVGLDASMSALMRPAFYPGAYHHITLPMAGARPLRTVDVVGSLCENIDKFAVDRLLPEPREGDVVMIHDTGAHAHAMGFTYNGRLRPAELMLMKSGDVLELRRPETFSDYVSTIQPGEIVLAGGGTSRTEASNTSLRNIA